MFIQNSVKAFLILNLAISTVAAAATQDFSKFDSESELFQVVRKIWLKVLTVKPQVMPDYWL